jgi:OPA family sugar phosphate sensor protein UhpC-like MFS transporter
VLVGIALFRFVLDRPQTYGLPPIAVYKQDVPDEADRARAPVGRQQLALLKHPAIWILGLASASMYVARYGINEWFVLYLQKAKAYDIVAAGLTTSFFPIVGAAGTLAAGPISDYLFGGRRLPVCLAYGVLLIGGLVVIPFIPPGYAWADSTAISVCGFAIGGLLVFLGGLIAIDIASQRAAGAAMGVIGVFSYLGAAAQNWISGSLIEAGKTVSDGETAYDFSHVFHFWVGAATLSLLLTILLAVLRKGRGDGAASDGPAEGAGGGAGEATS